MRCPAEERARQHYEGLSDTPASLANDKYLKVTNDGTGIEFVVALPNPTNTVFAISEALISNASSNIFKQIRQGS